MDYDKKCRACGSSHEIKGVTLTILFTTLLLVYLLIIIRKKIKNMLNPEDVLIKIAVDFLQISTISLTVSVNFLERLPKEFNITAMFNDSNQLLVGIECSLHIVLKHISIFHKKIILGCLSSFLFPLILFMICFIFGIIRNKKNKDQGSLFLISISLFIVFDTLQASFINMFFSALKCEKIDEVYYLSNFPEEQCWGVAHKVLLLFVLPCLIIWMFIIPTWIIYKINRRRTNLQFLGPYYYFTYGYRESLYFWDLVLMFRKYILILASTFIYDHILAHFILFQVLFIFMIFQTVLQPYSWRSFNRLAHWSNAASSSFLGCSLILIAVTLNRITVYVILALMLTANLSFILLWIVANIRIKKGILKAWNTCCISHFLKLAPVNLDQDRVQETIIFQRNVTKSFFSVLKKKL